MSSISHTTPHISSSSQMQNADQTERTLVAGALNELTKAKSFKPGTLLFRFFECAQKGQDFNSRLVNALLLQLSKQGLSATSEQQLSKAIVEYLGVKIPNGSGRIEADPDTKHAPKEKKDLHLALQQVELSQRQSLVPSDFGKATYCGDVAFDPQKELLAKATSFPAKLDKGFDLKKPSLPSLSRDTDHVNEKSIEGVIQKFRNADVTVLETIDNSIAHHLYSAISAGIESYDAKDYESTLSAFASAKGYLTQLNRRDLDGFADAIQFLEKELGELVTNLKDGQEAKRLFDGSNGKQ